MGSSVSLLLKDFSGLIYLVIRLKAEAVVKQEEDVGRWLGRGAEPICSLPPGSLGQWLAEAERQPVPALQGPPDISLSSPPTHTFAEC